jgi:hypothetical protein
VEKAFLQHQTVPETKNRNILAVETSLCQNFDAPVGLWIPWRQNLTATEMLNLEGFLSDKIIIWQN